MLIVENKICVLMNWFHTLNAKEIGTSELIYFVEFLAFYSEKNCQLLFTMVNYISILPAVHIATLIYCNSTEVHGSGSNEPSEKETDTEIDTEYTGASQEENEFERIRHGELDSLLDHLFPSTLPPEPKNNVEEWLEGLDKEGVDVRTGEGYESESDENSLNPEQEEIDVESDGGSESNYPDFFDFICGIS